MSEVDNEKSEGLKSRKCRACHSKMPAAAWKCAHCQNVHGLRSIVNFGVPILSVAVAVVALVPPLLDLRRASIENTDANIIADAQFDAELVAFNFSFWNLGKSGAIVPEEFDCMSRMGKQVGIFERAAPVLVPAEGSVTATYTIDLLNTGEETLTLRHPLAERMGGFFIDNRLSWTCDFSGGLAETDYYDFGGGGFKLAFNDDHSVPLDGVVRFQWYDN